MTKLKYAVDSPHTRPWAERIGRIIMNTSAVELESVLWFVQLTERHEDASRFFGQVFKTRILEIERHIEARGSTDKGWRRKALRAWNDARRLAAIRNQVAHNPLSFWWKDSKEQGEPNFVYVIAMRGAGRKPKDMLERHAADKAGNELAALAQQLAVLREQWCAQRDQGLVPPAAEPTGFWRRVRARIHRRIDKISMAMEAVRAADGQ
jgi:hypothetical protein